MALPHRKQQLARFIPFHGLSRRQVAKALGVSPNRVSNLIRGHTYPSPDEIESLERLFGLPIEVLLDEEMLEFRNGPWPVPTGYALGKLEAERQHPQEGGE